MNISTIKADDFSISRCDGWIKELKDFFIINVTITKHQQFYMYIYAHIDFFCGRPTRFSSHSKSACLPHLVRGGGSGLQSSS